MIVRIAEAAGLEPVDVDVELPGLARIAKEIDLIGGNPVGRVSPFKLLRCQNGHNRRIKLDGVGGGGETHDDGRNRASEVRQRMLCGHWLLPINFLGRGVRDASTRPVEGSLALPRQKNPGAVCVEGPAASPTSLRKRTTASLKISGCSMFEIWPACSIARKREPLMAACICRVFSGGA